MQLKLETRLVSSLEKVFAGQAPVAMAPSATMLRQDFLAFQLACRFENEGFSLGLRARVEVDTPLRVTVRQVEQMPVRMVSPPPRTATTSRISRDSILICWRRPGWGIPSW